MGTFVDLTGKTFGRLTVIKRVNNRHNRVWWLCKCSCGNLTESPGYSLKCGDTKSCGCLTKTTPHINFIDITGQRFGRWTVLSRAKNDVRNQTMWLCRCDCGTVRVVSGVNLRSGTSNSCGCLNLELISERNVERFKNYSLVGKKFGRLTVLERTDKRQRGLVIYKCKCDCGNIVFAKGCRLTEGSKQSCGCLNSVGEETISKLLRKNQIPFVQQKTFKDCINPKTNCRFRYDFFVDNKYLIEYDGIQHFEKKFKNDIPLELRQEYDRLKTEYCKSHKIPLIRIPYTKYKTLCLDDLLLEKSKFVI